MTNERETSRRALIVVDVQRDFCPGGALAVADGDKVVAPLNRLITEFLARDEPVFKTRDWHPEVTPHFKKDGGLWATHCVQNTAGAEFHDELIDDPRINIVSKGMNTADGYSAFEDTNLAETLHALGVEELWIGGLATDYCVKNTALDALREQFKVRVIGEAVRAVNLEPDDERLALAEMREAGAEVIGELRLPIGD